MYRVNIIKNKKKWLLEMGFVELGTHNLKNPLFKQEHKTKMRDQAKIHESLK